MQPDHYLALGIPPDATDAQVRAAYLRVMRVTHPDRRPGDSQAEDAARAANAAWEVLGTAARRGAYDRLRVVQDDGTVGHRVTVVRSEADAARAAAYRARSEQVSRELQQASVRIATGVFLLGLILLLGTMR